MLDTVFLCSVVAIMESGQCPPTQF